MSFFGLTSFGPENIIKSNFSSNNGIYKDYLLIYVKITYLYKIN
jgi:hypothetical protein